MKPSMIYVFLFALLLLCALILTFGKSLWRYWHEKRAHTLLPIDVPVIQQSGKLKDLIFLHHSTGRNLIKEGSLRALLAKKSYRLWDHDYNAIGLTDPAGRKLKICYDIPSDTSGNRGNGNTDPEGLYLLFSQPVHQPPDNALSRLLQHEVIIFKSCYPNSAIKDDQMLAQYKTWFFSIREKMRQHPEKIFIPFTIPPLHPLATNHEEAARARQWAQWLQSEDFLDNMTNVFVFDFFDLLADPIDHTLRQEYQRDRQQPDSHPNEQANKIVAQIFTEFIDHKIIIYIGKK